MATWNAQTLHKNMHVYSSDNNDLGHIIELFEDSFEVHKGIFSKKHYYTYSNVTSVEGDRVVLDMDLNAASELKWEVRPDYEDHPGDPTQLLYDRGHGVHDPFDETNPDKA